MKCISEIFFPLSFSKERAGVRFRWFTNPKIARLLDSVPPEVKIISCGRAFNISAIFLREASTAVLAFTPILVIEPGLPKLSVQNGFMAVSTSFLTGVVAEWSR
jgi:hypothetical protein